MGQCDEIWSYVEAKDKNLSAEKKEQGLSSIWTWTAIDADTKLIRVPGSVSSANCRLEPASI